MGAHGPKHGKQRRKNTTKGKSRWTNGIYRLTTERSDARANTVDDAELYDAIAHINRKGRR